MIRPTVLQPKPSIVLAVLGGLVATLLLSALIYVGPVLGFPFINIPLLVGGMFVGKAQPAFWIGYWVFFVVGVGVFAPLLALLWTFLPGNSTSFGGALLKGLIWGGLLWVVGGVLLPAFYAVNVLADEGLSNPGFFAYRLGALGAASLLLGHLAYGAAVALLTAMGQGIWPLDTLGWNGHAYGDVREDIDQAPKQRTIQREKGRYASQLHQ